MATGARRQLLRLDGISKTFDGVRVLSDASLEIESGEIHALLGQNGSGKSTIIKILAGFHAPDPGATLELRGQPVGLPLKSTAEPRGLGLAFVHQNLALVDEMSVVDNLRLGSFATRFGRIQWRQERGAAREILERYGIRALPSEMLGAVSHQADRALLAIARAVEQIRAEHDSAILVLDEPTVYLPEEDAKELLDVVRDLASRGNGILYVTHRLEELEGLVDRVTVLRDGRVVAHRPVAGASMADLVRMILGRELGDLYPEVQEREHRTPAMEVKGLWGDRIRGVDMELHEGEILGVTGLGGMGHEELPYLLYGAKSPGRGRITVDGVEVVLGSPRRARKAGIVLLPGDRARQGVFLEHTVASNLSLPMLSRYFRHGHISKREEVRDMAERLSDFNVVPPDPHQLLGRFSGGNQQKALLAKWLQVKPRIVLMDEPTQGIDIGSRKEIFARLSNVAAAGTSVLIASTEYEDLAHICHRVLVLRDGVIGAELAGANLSKDAVVQHCYLAGERQEGRE